LSHQLHAHVDSTQNKLENTVQELSHQLKAQATDTRLVRNTVEDAVRLKLQEDKEKEEKISKRKCSVIVHGLPEPSAESSESRLNLDNEMVENLLHKIDLDSVSVDKITRLGKLVDGQDAKPRPVKLTIASEAQKEQVLKQAKNLRKIQEGGMQNVFVHQASKTEVTGARIKTQTGGRRAEPNTCELENCHKKPPYVRATGHSSHHIKLDGPLEANPETNQFHLSGLQCLYTNANGLLGKIHELRHISSELHIIGVTETWASPRITDAELHIDGFKCLRTDRKDRKGGGVVLYIRDFVITEDVIMLTNIDFNESIWCIVRSDTFQLLVGLCYRSPTSSDMNNSQLLPLLDKAVPKAYSNNCMRIMIMGDFNYPEIDYLNCTVSTQENSPAYRFFQ